MEIKKIKITELKPSEYNPRKISKEERSKLKNSIERFGYVEPIIVNKTTGNIVGGHQRLDVLKELKIEEVDVVEIDINTNEEKALNLALNKISGEWDEDKLKDLLKGLDQEDKDLLEVTGFNDDELKDLLFEETPGETDDDKIPEDVPAIAKLGQLYELGSHRLLCGDTTNKEHVGTLMGQEKADMIITDPPYGVDYLGSRQQLQGKKQHNRPLMNDALTMEKFRSFIQDFFNIADKITTENSTIYIFHGDAKLQPLLIFLNTWSSKGWHHANEIIWRKSSSSLVWGDYRYIHECISFGWKGKKHYSLNNRSETDVWEIKKDDVNSYKHPTQKPVEMFTRAIKNSSKIDNLIFDGFGGSGSTLIAAEKFKRRCFMMELDPKYCDVIIKRWEDYTGKKAKLTKQNHTE